MASAANPDAITSAADLKPGHGIKEDFNAFVHHFTEKNTLRYEDFSELWKDLHMPYLFAGRREYELREAVEHSYICGIAVFNSGTNIQSKTCAVYLLYAIYQTQGLYPKARIRVTVTQFNAFVEFVDSMASKEHYDFVFVFMRLRMERAFLYVATPQIQGKPKKSKPAAGKMREILPTGLVSTFSDLSLDLVEDLTVVNEEYYRVKCVATNPEGHHAPPHPSLDLAKPDFIKDITRQLARFDNWRKAGKWKRKVVRKRTTSGVTTTSESEGDNASDSDSAPEQAETSIGSKRQQIREKAFGTVAVVQRSTRYRKVVGESSQSDGPPAIETKKKKSVPKTRTRPLTKEEEDEMAITNAHLQMATAPSKKERIRRRKVNSKTKRSRMTSPGGAEDADESS